MERFKENLNSQPRNIRFTSELEKDGKLPFLDMLIDRNSVKIVASISRKPTFTVVHTHFHSALPSVYKLH